MLRSPTGSQSAGASLVQSPDVKPRGAKRHLLARKGAGASGIRSPCFQPWLCHALSSGKALMPGASLDCNFLF